MREIKFRAWDPVSGFYRKCDVSSWSTYFSLPIFEMEQFTGLNDKNGKEIYEGDILAQGLGEAWQMNFEISWYKNGWWYFHRGEPHRGNVDPAIEEHELIGNIHENPELLKFEGSSEARRP